MTKPPHLEIMGGLMKKFLAYASGGNIIDDPVLAKFTELLFNQVGAHFLERKNGRPH